MSKEYDLTFQSRDEAIFDLEKLLVPAERLQDRFAYLAEYKDPQNMGQTWDFREDNNLHSVRSQGFFAQLLAEGMTGLEETHLRDTPTPAADRDWGGSRQGPPAVAYVTKGDA